MHGNGPARPLGCLRIENLSKTHGNGVQALTAVHVLGDRSPGERFERAEPDLEHVYFATLRGG